VYPGRRRRMPPGWLGRPPDVITVDTLAELAAIVREHGEIYLRHSLGPAADAHETSRDYESGLALPGLSAVPLAPPRWWSRPPQDWLARQIRKYARLAERGDGRYAWVLTGRVAGFGPDHEPLIAGVRPLARLADAALEEAQRRYHRRFEVGRDSLA
jgi:uncharacterized protein DUF6098